MAKAAIVRETGGVEVIQIEEVDVPMPGPGEALVRHTAIAVNFHDIYVRSGLYPVQHLLPLVLGTEAAGVIEAVGEGVNHVRTGDRVAYACRPYGAYSEARSMPARHLVRIPHAIDDRVAAAVMVRGMTAEYLLHRTHRVKSGDTILVHAAAGGVGLLLCQWARSLGVTVIGTVGSEKKTALAEEAGCHHVINYMEEDFVASVDAFTEGKGVAVVYDSVGKSTFAGSLKCLATRGHLINFGQSSGPIEGFEVSQLSEKSNTLSRPVLFHYTESREELEEISNHLFDTIAGGRVIPRIGGEYPLSAVASAQADLAARKTTGSILLIP